MLNILSITVWCLFLFLLYTIVMKPQIIANFYKKIYPETVSVYNLDEFENLKITPYKNDYKIYKFNDSTFASKTPVVVYVCGGVFVRSSPELKIVHEMSKKIQNLRIVAFTFPVRFSATTEEILAFMNELIFDYLMALYNDTRDLIFVAHSSGAFFSHRLIYDAIVAAQFNVKKFIAINGFFGSNVTDNFLYKLASWYYVENYGKYKLKEDTVTAQMATLMTLISNENDFLLAVNENMAKKNNIALKVFKGNHSTVSNINDEENPKMIEYITNAIIDV